MVTILVMIAVLLPLLAGLGLVFEKLFRLQTHGMADVLINGIFITTVVWSLLAFFIPLNATLELLTVITGLTAFFYFRGYLIFWGFFAEHFKLFTVISLTVIGLGSFYPYIIDHFGYYVPTVNVLSTVGLVRGISNLDLLLGQMSFWHVFQAGFSHYTDPFLRMNVLILVIYTIYILEQKSWVHLFFFPVLALFVQSPSPDLPVIVLSLITLNDIFTGREKPLMHFLLASFVFGVKPTMIWLPLFTLLYYLIITKAKLKYFVPGLLMLGLFFFKNIWTFGFPVFPVQIPDLGIPWKPADGLLKNSAEAAVQKTFDMQYTSEQIKNFSGWDYVKNWLFLEGIKSKIHIAFITVMLLFLILTLFRKSKVLWLLFISVLVKTALVLIFSAQYRFFFDVFFVVVFIAFYRYQLRTAALAVFSIGTGMAFLFFFNPKFVQTHLPSFRLGGMLQGTAENQWRRPASFALKKYRTYQLGNLKFHVSEGYPLSFDTPLPAISAPFLYEDLEAGIFPQLRGNKPEEGFIWRPLSEDEKKELHKIIKDFESRLPPVP